jgi:hypothetical protein
MIRRHRRADGAPFWGCPRYPACRGTRADEVAVVPPLAPIATGDDPVGPRPGGAGASARAEFDRRLARHRAAAFDRLPGIVLRSGFLIVFGLVVTTLGPSWQLLGWLLVVIGALSAFIGLVGLPANVRAWRTGAAGEERTGDVLDPLEAEGYVVLHDLRMPGSRANIDHLVIGPTGVWVVETKSYEGALRVRGGELWIGGRRRPGFVDQARREAAAVAETLEGVAVTPLLCVHRADFPLLSRPQLDGVAIVGPGRLARVIREGPVVLDPAEVERLAALAEARL